MERIHNVLSALGPSLERLFYDVDVDDPAIYRTMERLTNIQEFCIAPSSMVFDGDKMPSWQTLKRIAINGAMLGNRLIWKLSEMEGLETCILAWIDGMQGESGIFRLKEVALGSWTKGRGRELTLTLMETEEGREDWTAARCRSRLGSLDIESADRGLLQMMEVPRLSNRDGSITVAQRSWFCEVSRNGTIWDLPRVPWSVYQDKPYVPS